jgi:murein DD-endopeptidase MepM/ murein hydrolase activator NlpD
VGIDSKEVHSTVNGVVEKAGWENPLKRKQGFGLYVRIKQDGTVDRYYYGHLSQLNVKKGDIVKIGDVIGIEGSTGKSTGSHCHYCIRGNSSKSQIRDVCAISGIPNKLGTYDDGYLAKLNAEKKTELEIAQEILEGKWGNGEERRKKLADAGYDYNKIQAEVNKLVSPPKKTNEEIAREVIAGAWGNGQERKDRLRQAGYNPSVIQRIVNKLI